MMKTKMDSCNVLQAARLLKEQDRFLLLTHKNPDGDTLCSAAALCHALRRAGKTAFLYRNEQITEKYLPYVSTYLEETGFVPEYIIAVVITGISGKSAFILRHKVSIPL